MIPPSLVSQVLGESFEGLGPTESEAEAPFVSATDSA
eukprot:SAG22_NODE_8706_length_635_cov_1.895522_1_plen_36_part_10